MNNDFQPSSPNQDEYRQEPNNSNDSLSPEELAESAFTSDTAPPDFAVIADKKPKAQKRRSLKHLFEKFQRLNKKQKALVIISAAIVLAGIMFAVWFFVLRAEP